MHFEIPIDDPDRAGAFYRAVFGWEAQKWGPVQYWPMTTGQEPGVGPGAEGALTLRAEAPEGVLVYVDDVDAALKTVENAGGTVVHAKSPSGRSGGRRTCATPRAT